MKTIKEIIKLENKIYSESKNESFFNLQYKINWYNVKGNGADLAGIKLNNLSYNEAFFIYIYTGFASTSLNSYLCHKLESDEIKEAFSENLNYSLNKVIQQKDSIVYHIDKRTTEDKLNWIRNCVDKIILIPWFLSTSTEKINFEDENEENSIVWIIKTFAEGSKSHYIGNLTNNKYEKEVLFNTNSKFIIKETIL